MNTPTARSLNPLQRAYLLGRSELMPLGGNAMFDFREFYCDFTPAQLQQAMLALAKRHPLLRTVVDEVDLVQRVLDDVVLNVGVSDFRELQDVAALEQIAVLRHQYCHSMLPLDQPLWRMHLIMLPQSMSKGTKKALIFVCFDGLVADGFAISILLKELFVAGFEYKPTPNLPTPGSYFSNLADDQAYWTDKLAAVEQVTTLPWLTDPEVIFSPRYQREGIELTKANWQKVCSLAARQRLLPNTVLTAAIFEVLRLWTADNNLLLSMPVSSSVLQQELGNHASFIAIGYNATSQQSFTQKAGQLQKDVLVAMAHTSFSGTELGKMLVKKTAKAVPLPIAMTNALSWGSQAYDHAEFVTGITQTPQLALDIRISQTADHHIAIDFDYAVQALSALVIKQMLTTLRQYLSDLADMESLEQMRAPRFVKADTAQQGATGFEVRVENHLQRIQQHLYAENNQHTALIFDGNHISYSTLGHNVAKITTGFKAANVKSGDVVAICLAKSPEQVAVTLACSLANIIWLPLDMASPPQRIQFMLSNCKADFLVCDQVQDYGIQCLYIQQLLNEYPLPASIDSPPAISDKPGYYLYTSGSTGTPKCVVLNHLATANVIELTNKNWALSQADVFFAATPCHHDMFLYELFGAMSLGATLVLPTPDQAKSAMDWASLVEQHKVSVWSSVPAIVDMLLTCAEPRQLQSLKLISQGGDYVKPAVITQLRKMLPETCLFSVGGPTETTIWSIWHQIQPADIEVIPYGSALSHNRYYVVNDEMQHCPDFVTGTICMSGLNLANGYLKDGEIDHQDFVMIDDPKGQPVRVFKSSDRGYFTENGVIIFAGRKEGYLKVRGIRIASAEVEACLNKHPAILQSIALTTERSADGASELAVVYVCQTQQQASHAELRQFLQARLPASHIPSRWLLLDTVPLTANGKIDRKQLKTIAEQSFYQSPQASISDDPLLAMLVEVFAAAAGVELGSVELQTSVTSLGLRTKQLSLIAGLLSETLVLDISLQTLVQAGSVWNIAEELNQMMQLEHVKSA